VCVSFYVSRKVALEHELDLLEADIKKLAARGDICVAAY
jgi:hypothetical protein